MVNLDFWTSQSNQYSSMYHVFLLFISPVSSLVVGRANFFSLVCDVVLLAFINFITQNVF